MEKENNKKTVLIIVGVLLAVILLTVILIATNIINLKQKNDNQGLTEKQLDQIKKYENTELEKSLGINYPLFIEEKIETSDKEIMGYIICEIEEELYATYDSKVCLQETQHYYSLSNKNITNNYYEIRYLDDNHVVASYLNGDTYNCDILDIKSGNLIKKLDYYTVSTEKIDNKDYYYGNNGGPGYSDIGEILDKEFKSIIKDFSSYAYVVNKNNTITIIPYETSKYNKECDDKLPTKFYIYNLNGNKLYESKEYDHVVAIGRGYEDLLVVDNENINIIDYKDNLVKTLIKGNICGTVQNQRTFDDYYFPVEKDRFYTYDRKNEKLIKD